MEEEKINYVLVKVIGLRLINSERMIGRFTKWISNGVVLKNRMVKPEEKKAYLIPKYWQKVMESAWYLVEYAKRNAERYNNELFIDVTATAVGYIYLLWETLKKNDYQEQVVEFERVVKNMESVLFNSEER